MQIEVKTAEPQLARYLENHGVPDANAIAWATIWLEACGYAGMKFLAEALTDEQRSAALKRDAIGFDLHNTSCVFLAPAIMRDVAMNGRVFLRNVRHGLFLLPFTVKENIAIGCPVDPAFAIGGERTKNPYAEKLAMAESKGIEIDDALWVALVPGTSSKDLPWQGH
jgi:hypothetical protein